MANRSLPASRYFGAFVLIVAILYALVFFTRKTHTPQLRLDLRGGTTVTLTARTPDGKAPAKADLELARQIIEQRVNGLGVAEAEVVTEGDSNIIISVPGDNGDQARQLGATAQLRFRPVVKGPEPAAQAVAGGSASASATPSAGATPSGSAPATPSAATPPRRRPPGRPRPGAPAPRHSVRERDPHRFRRCALRRRRERLVGARPRRAAGDAGRSHREVRDAHLRLGRARVRRPRRGLH